MLFRSAEIKAGAQQIMQQIDLGAPFAVAARQLSQSPSAAEGGDIGWVTEGQLAPELNAVLGTKFKIVTGYKDSAEALLAMERGETRGFCAWGWSTMMAIRPEWVKAGKIRPLVQFGQKKHPEHLDVPLVLDLARTPQDRAALEAVIAPQLFARPFAGPPGVPPERVAALRKAFAATLNDPAYRADAEKAGIEYDLVQIGRAHV